MSNETEIAVRKSSETEITVSNPFAPRNLEDAFRLAKTMAESDLVPKDYKGKPANCFIAMQMGSEIGIGPMQSVQNIAVINGRPSMWGDLGLALVKSHRDFVSIKESITGDGDAQEAVCVLSRRNEPDVTSKFSVADAKKARLWGKEGTWSNYPKRMLQMRARWFAMRDQFPDALKGISSAEESSDIVMVEAEPESTPFIEPKAVQKEETRKPTAKKKAEEQPVTPPPVPRITSEEFSAVKARWNSVAENLSPETQKEGASYLKKRFGFETFDQIHPDQLIDVMVAIGEIGESKEPGA